MVQKLVFSFVSLDQNSNVSFEPERRTMSARIAYFRVSTKDQSIDAQRVALGGDFSREFEDEGVSGSVLAADRPGFAALLGFVREGDTVFVSAVDRLGRDAIDVQTTVRFFLDKGVSVDVKGLGVIGRGVGELIIAVLAQVAQMERARILERCESGRDAARVSLAATGKTHKGKVSLGRPVAGVAVVVMAWKTAHSASIAKTAEQFKISTATVKRYASASN
jgi:putative DNA-invertase from lambdoid prophage Rac